MGSSIVVGRHVQNQYKATEINTKPGKLYEIC